MNRICLLAALVPSLAFLIASAERSAAAGTAAQSATPPHHALVGGGCDGCELMYVGLPSNIPLTDTSPGWTQDGQKLLITGTIFKRDGKTPAPDVVLYYYHTDVTGHYADRKGLDRRAARHGYIRGWVKSDAEGRYSIHTVRPAPYPGASAPAHIHPTIKEPGINEYYIDEFVFDDDKLLTGARRKAFDNRGGSGVLRLLRSDGLYVAEHDIILGLNIPNYPTAPREGGRSGLEVGQDFPSFVPFHAWGPDKGSRACPVCKYGRYHGVVLFVGNNPKWNDIQNWLAFLERESEARGKFLKAYFVYGNENGYTQQARQAELERIGAELKLKRMALTFVPSLKDEESEVSLHKLDPNVTNTIVVFRNRKIVEKFVDLKPTTESFARLSGALDRTKGRYFDLSE